MGEKIESINLSEIVVPEGLIKKIPRGLIEKYQFIPIGLKDNLLTVVFDKKPELDVVDEIQMVTNYKIKVVLASKESLRQAIFELFHKGSLSAKSTPRTGLRPISQMSGNLNRTVVAKTCGLAIASLVLGIIGFMCGIPAVLAIIFGIIALNQINKSAGVLKGKGLAITGIILSGFWIILFGILFTTTSLFIQEGKRELEKQAYTVYEMRETVSIGYMSYKVWDAWWSDMLSDNEFLNERPDASFLFIDLSVRNDDKKARTISPFHLIDENGAEYEISSKAWCVKEGLGILHSLNPSVQKKGIIAFDVPRTHNYWLKVSGGYWSADRAFIQITPSESTKTVEKRETIEEEVKNKPIDIKVSADELYQDYDTNEVAADEKYKDKILLVSGTVKSISRSGWDKKIYVSLRCEFLSSVRCYFSEVYKKEVSQLVEGQGITVKGKCTGREMMDVHLEGCSLVE